MLRPYAVMLPRLQAQQTQDLISALLYTNGHQLEQKERGGYSRALERQADGGQAPQRAPAITPAFAKRIGVQIGDGKGGEIDP